MDHRSRMNRRLGVWTTAELRAAGMSAREIAARIDDGTLRRARPGRFVTSSTPASVTAALQHGARVTCVSAAELHGLWTPLFTGVHVACRRGGGHGAPGIITEHRPTIRAWPDDDLVLPLETALIHAGTCLSGESNAVLLESALERAILDRTAVESIVGEMPIRVQRELTGLRADAGSGSETRVRRYLERQGVNVRAQVWLTDVGRVDLLVGDRLIIECDSRAFHDSDDSFETDRLRDLRATSMGYAVVRLSWHRIWMDWKRTRGELDGLVRSGVHRWRGRRSVPR